MHAIAWGRRLLGKVDRVPGRCHVATQFWMFCYLPLVPLATYVITREHRHGMQGEFQGVKIPLSLKSIAVAWFRSLLGGLFTIFAMGSAAVLVGLLSGEDKITWAIARQFFSVTAVIAVVLFAPYWIPGIGRATATRATELESALEDYGEPAQDSGMRVDGVEEF